MSVRESQSATTADGVSLADAAVALTSNGHQLAFDPDRIGDLVSSSAAAPIDDLRRQFAEQGYLWLPGFLPPDDVDDIRRRFYTHVRSCGITERSVHEAGTGAAGSDGEPDLAARDALIIEFVRLAAFESFCLHPRIRRFYEALLGGDVMQHRRKIVRHVVPGELGATGAHYDVTYLRGGDDGVCTSWIPLADCPLGAGGLVYLEHSEPIARVLEGQIRQRRHGMSESDRQSAYTDEPDGGGWITTDLASLAERFDRRWLVADFGAGDMVVHGAYTIHASTQNVDVDGRMRLSTDIRFQRTTEQIDQRWQQHLSWDDGL